MADAKCSTLLKEVGGGAAMPCQWAPVRQCLCMPMGPRRSDCAFVPQAGLEAAVREMSQVPENQVIRVSAVLRACTATLARARARPHLPPSSCTRVAAGSARHPSGHLPKQVQGDRLGRSHCPATQAAAARPAAISALRGCVRTAGMRVTWRCVRLCARTHTQTTLVGLRKHANPHAAPQRTSYEHLRCLPDPKYRRCP